MILELARRHHPEQPQIAYRLAVCACGEGDMISARNHLVTAFSRDNTLKLIALADPELSGLWLHIA